MIRSFFYFPEREAPDVEPSEELNLSNPWLEVSPELTYNDIDQSQMFAWGRLQNVTQTKKSVQPLWYDWFFTYQPVMWTPRKHNKKGKLGCGKPLLCPPGALLSEFCKKDLLIKSYDYVAGAYTTKNYKVIVIPLQEMLKSERHLCPQKPIWNNSDIYLHFVGGSIEKRRKLESL